MENELKAAQARISELEGALSWHEEQRNDMAGLRAEQQGVVDGCKLVPVEPTTEMICAAACAITTPDDLPPISAGWTMSDLAFRSRYMAALAAAPAPSTIEGQGDE
jgi:hypothetical protein